jgi:hypothetical protein
MADIGQYGQSTVFPDSCPVSRGLCLLLNNWAPGRVPCCGTPNLDIICSKLLSLTGRVTMAVNIGTFAATLLVLLTFCMRALADCSSYGVDYANGGAYYIDGSSNQYFSFITVFQGQRQSSCPALTRAIC